MHSENISTLQMTKGKILIALLAASFMASGPSLALEEAKENPKLQYRQNVMEIVKYSLLGMRDIIKGDVADQSQFPALARSMANASSIATRAFTPDTRSFEGKTTAKDSIWENWQDFSKRMDAFNADTQALAMVAKEGDMKANILAFKKAAKNCKSCHDEYRKDDK